MSIPVGERLLEELRYHEAHPLFVTGAGISIASGIAPFRGTADAVWAQDVLEKGTNRYFLQHPHKSWAWYLSRFDGCRNAEPNPAHRALALIEDQLTERGRGFNLVTQNVDGLHLAAGSKNLIECHGTARHLRCTNRYCKFGPPKGVIEWDESLLIKFRAEPTRANVPRCPECSKFLRAHCLWFDETYSGHESYGIDEIDALLDKMTIVVFVGTSFAVTITDLVMTSAYQRNVPMFNLDPHAEDIDGLITIKAKAEEFLPQLAKELYLCPKKTA